MYYYGHSAAQIVVDVKYPESFEWRLANTFINRMLFRSLFIPLSLFFESLHCLSFHLRILITLLCIQFSWTLRITIWTNFIALAHWNNLHSTLTHYGDSEPLNVCSYSFIVLCTYQIPDDVSKSQLSALDIST